MYQVQFAHMICLPFSCFCVHTHTHACTHAHTHTHTQIYELHNVGEAAATYEVDSAPLHALTVSNCMVPVLQCLAVQGEVAPGETTSVPFIFSPLEARRYSVSVCVFVMANGTTYRLTHGLREFPSIPSVLTYL